MQDASTAKALAFAREVKTRCVTLDGDDFNPSGTLTGGLRSTTRKLAPVESALLNHILGEEKGTYCRLLWHCCMAPNCAMRLLHAGGSRSKGASVLARLHALAEAQAEMEAHSAALQRAEEELQARARAADEHRRRAFHQSSQANQSSW